MNSNDVDWSIEPEATHFCPETEENFPCFFKKDVNGVWMGKLASDADNWGHNVMVTSHVLAHMIPKEERQ